MHQLPPFPDKYWLRFSETPVTVLPFDPKSLTVAQKYIQKLEPLFGPNQVQKIYHRGSTALQIAGKGDIEIGIIPAVDSWYETIVQLSQHYKGIGNLDDDYCRFNDFFVGAEIEIILMRGYTAQLDGKLHQYLRSHLEWLTQYEEVKRQNAFSKREYNRQKDLFFRQVIEEIPE